MKVAQALEEGPAESRDPPQRLEDTPLPTAACVNFQPLHRLSSRAPQGDGKKHCDFLKSLTEDLVGTYKRCSAVFEYSTNHAPRRVLTKLSKGVHNGGYDNSEHDYICKVGDKILNPDGQTYEIMERLGHGTFGQVLKCRQGLEAPGSGPVALKIIKNKPAYFHQALMEVRILQMLNTEFDPEDDKRLVRMLDFFVYRKHLCIAFELLSVNLYEVLKQNSFRGVSMALIRVLTDQLLKAMRCLREACVIHCDLKPENVLLSNMQHTRIKLIDFGSACFENHTVYSYIQSRFYRSPEVLLGIEYTSAIDMWSLGCICAELFLGLPIFPGHSEYDQTCRIVEVLKLPPVHMLDRGTNTRRYFKRVEEQPSGSGKCTSMSEGEIHTEIHDFPRGRMPRVPLVASVDAAAAPGGQGGDESSDENPDGPGDATCPAGIQEPKASAEPQGDDSPTAGAPEGEAAAAAAEGEQGGEAKEPKEPKEADGWEGSGEDAGACAEELPEAIEESDDDLDPEELKFFDVRELRLLLQDHGIMAPLEASEAQLIELLRPALEQKRARQAAQQAADPEDNTMPDVSSGTAPKETIKRTNSFLDLIKRQLGISSEDKAGKAVDDEAMDEEEKALEDSPDLAAGSEAALAELALDAESLADYYSSGAGDDPPGTAPSADRAAAAKVFYLRALAHKAGGKLEEALADLREAWRLDPAASRPWQSAEIRSRLEELYESMDSMANKPAQSAPSSDETGLPESAVEAATSQANTSKQPSDHDSVPRYSPHDTSVDAMAMSQGASTMGPLGSVTATLVVPAGVAASVGSDGRQQRSSRRRRRHNSRTVWRLKTVEEYEREADRKEPIPKKYFNFKSLKEMIDMVPYKSNLSSRGILEEQDRRLCFLQFLDGVLQVDPVTRWTPAQASQHAFITGAAFDKDFKPPADNAVHHQHTHVPPAGLHGEVPRLPAEALGHAAAAAAGGGSARTYQEDVRQGQARRSDAEQPRSAPASSRGVPQRNPASSGSASGPATFCGTATGGKSDTEATDARSQVSLGDLPQMQVNVPSGLPHAMGPWGIQHIQLPDDNPAESYRPPIEKMPKDLIRNAAKAQMQAQEQVSSFCAASPPKCNGGAWSISTGLSFCSSNSSAGSTPTGGRGRRGQASPYSTGSPFSSAGYPSKGHGQPVGHSQDMRMGHSMGRHQVSGASTTPAVSPHGSSMSSVSGVPQGSGAGVHTPHRHGASSGASGVAIAHRRTEGTREGSRGSSPWYLPSPMSDMSTASDRLQSSGVPSGEDSCGNSYSDGPHCNFDDCAFDPSQSDTPHWRSDSDCATPGRSRDSQHAGYPAGWESIESGIARLQLGRDRLPRRMDMAQSPGSNGELGNFRERVGMNESGPVIPTGHGPRRDAISSMMTPHHDSESGGHSHSAGHGRHRRKHHR